MISRRTTPNKLITVDLDDTLSQTCLTLCSAHNHHHGTSLLVCHHTEYMYNHVPGWGTLKEAESKLRRFYDEGWLDSAPPVEGSQEALKWFKRMGWGVEVVTGRNETMRERTEEWLERHFKGLVDSVHFTDGWTFMDDQRTKIQGGEGDQEEQSSGMRTPKGSKLNIIQHRNPALHIDDHVNHAVTTANTQGRKCILYSPKDYSWNRGDHHRLLSKEVEDQGLVVRLEDWGSIFEFVESLSL